MIGTYQVVTLTGHSKTRPVARGWVNSRVHVVPCRRQRLSQAVTRLPYPMHQGWRRRVKLHQLDAYSDGQRHQQPGIRRGSNLDAVVRQGHCVLDVAQDFASRRGVSKASHGEVMTRWSASLEPRMLVANVVVIVGRCKFENLPRKKKGEKRPEVEQRVNYVLNWLAGQSLSQPL